jgi:hypothetical protein
VIALVACKAVIVVGESYQRHRKTLLVRIAERLLRIDADDADMAVANGKASRRQTLRHVPYTLNSGIGCVGMPRFQSILIPVAEAT